MKNLENYFNDARNFANERFYSADGFDDDFSFADEDYGFADDYSNADGGMGAAPTSQPYIVSVANASTAAVANVTLLGAYSVLGVSNYGNATTITITMGISGINYQEFLYQSMNKPFSVGLTYMQSTTSNQVLETLTVTQKDVNGNVSSKVLVPTIDPYQQQTNIVAFKFEYRIDGFTSIIISSMLGSATLKLYFYPSETVSTSRALAGRKAVQNLGNPNITPLLNKPRRGLLRR
jgi:hypothetical protein